MPIWQPACHRGAVGKELERVRQPFASRGERSVGRLRLLPEGSVGRGRWVRPEGALAT